MRELNRLGLTGAIDAGGGSRTIRKTMPSSRSSADEGQLTIRLAYNLFTQKPKGEKDDFLNWTKTSKYKQGNDYFRHNGAGEMLVFSAADFEDFREPRPDMPPQMESELESGAHPRPEPLALATARHLRRDDLAARSMCSRRSPEHRPRRAELVLRPRRDHLRRSIDRIAALGGGIAVQHRMAYQGEYFVERYGRGAAEATPPVRRILDKGVKVSAGTDATRVASYNPWVALAWLITGRTVGGLRLYSQRNCLDREAALPMWTENVTWFSNEEGKKGRIEVGQFADLIVPDRDFFGCAESEIADITSDLTVVGGRIVYGAGDFKSARWRRAPARDA